LFATNHQFGCGHHGGEALDEVTKPFLDITTEERSGVRANDGTRCESDVGIRQVGSHDAFSSPFHFPLGSKQVKR